MATETFTDKSASTSPSQRWSCVHAHGVMAQSNREQKEQKPFEWSLLVGQICGTGPDGCESTSSCQSSVRQNLRWSLVSVRRIKAVIYMTLENIKIPWLWFNGRLSVSAAAFGCVNDTVRKESVFYDSTTTLLSLDIKTALCSDQELYRRGDHDIIQYPGPHCWAASEPIWTMNISLLERRRWRGGVQGV